MKRPKKYVVTAEQRESPKNRKNRLVAVRTRLEHEGRVGVLVKGVTSLGLRTFRPGAEMNSLHIDESYQRGEIRNHVNRLIAVLESGGQIPEPITVAQRADGRLVIVDGQQRYWAHWNCGRPISGLVYTVPNIDAEKALFAALNATVRPHPNIRVKSWPGAAGRLIYFLDHAETSPLRGVIDYGNGATTFAASVVAQAVLVAATGVHAKGGVEETMRGLDQAIRTNAVRLDEVALGAARLWIAVFGTETRPRRGWVVGLMAAAAERWQERKGPMPGPQGRALLNIRKMNWNLIAPGGLSHHTAGLTAEVLRRWKED